MRERLHVVCEKSHGYYTYFFSCSRSHLFRSIPPPYPTSRPSLPITRWQGMTMTIGFLLLAPQMARTAFGFHVERASSR